MKADLKKRIEKVLIDQYYYVREDMPGDWDAEDALSLVCDQAGPFEGDDRIAFETLSWKQIKKHFLPCIKELHD